MNDIYKRLGEAKSDKERIKIYEELVQFQQKKIEDLANENQKLRERVKNQKEEVERLKKELGDDGLIKLLIKANEEADKLGTNINQTQVLIEAKK
jgi:reverse gyrase